MIAKVFLTFPQQLVQEPVLHDLIRRFPVRTNIRGASVTPAPAAVSASIACWLRSSNRGSIASPAARAACSTCVRSPWPGI